MLIDISTRRISYCARAGLASRKSVSAVLHGPCGSEGKSQRKRWERRRLCSNVAIQHYDDISDCTQIPTTRILSLNHVKPEDPQLGVSFKVLDVIGCTHYRDDLLSIRAVNINKSGTASQPIHTKQLATISGNPPNFATSRTSAEELEVSSLELEPFETGRENGPVFRSYSPLLSSRKRIQQWPWLTYLHYDQRMTVPQVRQDKGISTLVNSDGRFERPLSSAQRQDFVNQYTTSARKVIRVITFTEALNTFRFGDPEVLHIDSVFAGYWHYWTNARDMESEKNVMSDAFTVAYHYIIVYLEVLNMAAGRFYYLRHRITVKKLLMTCDRYRMMESSLPYTTRSRFNGSFYTKLNMVFDSIANGGQESFIGDMIHILGRWSNGGIWYNRSPQGMKAIMSSRLSNNDALKTSVDPTNRCCLFHMKTLQLPLEPRLRMSPESRWYSLRWLWTETK
jgi:hypothetical protein